MENLNLLQYVICAVILYLIIKRDDSTYEINGKEKCKNCGKIIETNTLICPNCQEEVKKICDSCGRLMDIDWRYCPFCEKNEKK